MAATEQTIKQVNTLGDTDYKYGFSTELDEIRPPKGLNENIIKFICEKKDSKLEKKNLLKKILKN